MDEFITGVDEYMASGLLPFYYSFVFLSGLFILFKYKNRKYSFFIFLLFWEGLFVYLGNIVSTYIYDFYKIFIVIFALLLFGKYFFYNLSKKFRFLNWLFLFYTIVIFFSMILNTQPVLTSLSQYGKKYLMFFLIFHSLFSSKVNVRVLSYYGDMLYNIILIQILLSIFKIFILGFGESIVGSLAFIGGGLATTLPMLGLVFIWNKSSGIIRGKDWLIIFGLLIVAVASNKRAAVFILPLLTVVMYTYVYQTRKILSFVKYVPLVLIILYVGIRSNPSLNPENSRWGSFDIPYATGYAEDYLFGSNKQLNNNSEIAYGRGDSFLRLFFAETYKVPTKNLLIGQGVTEVLKSYEEFNTEKYAVSHKGALNGALLKYISYGILGMFMHLLLGLKMIFFYGVNRFSKLLLILFLGDFFFYDGVIFENGAIALLMIFLIRIQMKD